MKYRFSEKPNSLIGRLLVEAEDNFAVQSDVNAKLAKTTGFVKQVPKLKEMNDGDELAYDDGSNCYLYRRIGSKLYRFQLTEI